MAEASGRPIVEPEQTDLGSYDWMPPTQPDQRRAGPVDMVFRPRFGLRFLTVLVGIGAPAGFLASSYQQLDFDPRVLLIAVYGALVICGVLRARIAVGNGQLNRRMLFGRRLVALDSLGVVQIARSRYLRRQGILPTRLAVVADRSGQAVSLKPALWQRGAGPLLATLAVCCRAQGLTIDESTEKLLGRARDAWSNEVPGWAYRPGGEPRLPVPLPPRRMAVLFDRFLTARDEYGHPKKYQWRRLIAILGVLGLVVPTMLFVSRAGTSAIRAARCGSASSLWANAPDFPADANDTTSMSTVTAAAAAEIGWLGRPTLYNLAPDDLFNQYNTSAVHRDATTLAAGQDLRWQKGGTILADLQIERFPTHQAALAFQIDYAKDHCAEGDHLFATPGVLGGIGVRCQCTGTTVDDRISFVRGVMRLQAIYWVVPAGQGHQEATRMAEVAVRAATPPSPAS